MTNTEIAVSVKLCGIEEATAKAAQLAVKIEEAKTLAGELASLLEKLEVNI